MKQTDHLNGKINFDIRKRAMNGKLFQNQKNIKQDIIVNAKKAMAKKYMQQHNIFKQKQDEPKKQHRQIVMSQQFIKSSKLYRLLKQKIDRSDSLFVKQVNCIHQSKMKLKEQIMQIKSQNYQQKVSLWQLKNKLMQLKIVYHEEQEESKIIAEQNYEEYEQEEGQYEEQNEMEINPQNEIEGDKQEKVQMMQQEQKSGMNEQKYEVKEERMQVKQRQNEELSRAKFSQILHQLMSLKAQRRKIQSHKPHLTQIQINQFEQKHQQVQIGQQSQSKCVPGQQKLNPKQYKQQNIRLLTEQKIGQVGNKKGSQQPEQKMNSSQQQEKGSLEKERIKYIN